MQGHWFRYKGWQDDRLPCSRISDLETRPIPSSSGVLRLITLGVENKDFNAKQNKHAGHQPKGYTHQPGVILFSVSPKRC